MQYTAALEYQNQSGALNESVSDVMGIMAKQYGPKRTAAGADWLIGEECLYPGVKGVALRSMKNARHGIQRSRSRERPPTGAYGRYVLRSNNQAGDYGGVHYNSGIPNRAFYLTCIRFGGYSWEKLADLYAAINDERIEPSW